jgi:hypothetical protein
MDRPTEAITDAKFCVMHGEKVLDGTAQDLLRYIEHLEAERDTARQQLAAATAEAARLREALEVYADEAVWRASEGEPGYLEYNGSFGGYDVARQALAATPEED